MSLRREAIGFALAPLPFIAPVTLMFGVILLDQPDDSASVIAAWLELVFASYGVSLLVGVPVHLALVRLGRCSLRSYLAATTLGVTAIGVGIGLLQVLLPPSPEQNPFGLNLASRTGLTAMLLLEGLALVSAWIFWRASVRKKKEAKSAAGPSVSA